MLFISPRSEEISKLASFPLATAPAPASAVDSFSTPPSLPASPPALLRPAGFLASRRTTRLLFLPLDSAAATEWRRRRTPRSSTWRWGWCRWRARCARGCRVSWWRGSGMRSSPRTTIPRSPSQVVLFRFLSSPVLRLDVFVSDLFWLMMLVPLWIKFSCIKGVILLMVHSWEAITGRNFWSFFPYLCLFRAYWFNAVYWLLCLRFGMVLFLLLPVVSFWVVIVIVC